MARAHTGTPPAASQDRRAERSGDIPKARGRGTAEHDIEAGAKEAEGLAERAFFKFNNDWTMNLVAMVSYNVLTSFFPLVLALITILALVPAVTGNTHAVASQINAVLPSDVRSQLKIDSLITSVSHQFGLLTLVSILGLLWGGSNLFGSLESAFAVIFRVKTRDFLPQKLMSVAMILLFVVLLPLSFVSTIFISAASTTLGRIVPGALSGPFAVAVGLAASLASLFALFVAIYMVVPNIPIRWRYAWRGALVAAVVMWIINTIFPFYTAHFVGTKQYGTAALGTAIITITWFWFFSLVLLVGAQVNALAMGIGYWKYDLTRVLMEAKIPTQGGAPTAMAALEANRDPSVTDAPVGLARDSQKVENPARERRETPDRDRDGGPTSGQGTRPPSGGTPRSEAAGAGTGAKRGPAPQRASRQGGTEYHAVSAREADLVATGIAKGGVQMATTEESLGPERFQPLAIALGAAVGLVQGLRGLRHSR